MTNNNDNLKYLSALYILQNKDPKPVVGPIGPPGEIASFSLYNKIITKATDSLVKVDSIIDFNEEIINSNNSITKSDELIIFKKNGVYLIYYELPIKENARIGLKLNDEIINYMTVNSKNSINFMLTKLGIIKVLENNS